MCTLLHLPLLVLAAEQIADLGEEFADVVEFLAVGDTRALRGLRLVELVEVAVVALAEAFRAEFAVVGDEVFEAEVADELRAGLGTG